MYLNTVKYFRILTDAANKWISSRRWWTPADGGVVKDAAHSAVAACARAGVHTLVTHAGSVAGAL